MSAEDTFYCEDHRAILARWSCGERWVAANRKVRATAYGHTGQGPMPTAGNPCVECPIGREHSKGGEPDVPLAELTILGAKR